MITGIFLAYDLQEEDGIAYTLFARSGGELPVMTEVHGVEAAVLAWLIPDRYDGTLMMSLL